jgi:D-alanyl-D-alanine carboxypeptidase/D-alanyl-D-alanine-endopeptidase (penicillin-binding protein 4)
MDYNLAAPEFSQLPMNLFTLQAASSRRSHPAAVLLTFWAIVLSAGPIAAQKTSAGTPARRQPNATVYAKQRADVAKFRARIEALLGEEHARRGYWGVEVRDGDTGEALYELNADHFFVPGSNAKVFTTAFALATLGVDYRFRTTLDSRTSLDSDGHLAGDLILFGDCDPDLSNHKFPWTGKVERDGPVDKILAELADAAVAKGLKEVDGDIVAADPFSSPYDPYPAGWAVGDLFFAFGAPVTAITLNENTISIEIRPGENAGTPALIAVEPGAAAETFGHEIITSAANEKPDFSVVRRPGLNFIFLRGSIPAGHEPVKLDLAMTDPSETTARTLKHLLEARGVRVTGGIRVEHGSLPERKATGEVSLTPRGGADATNPMLTLVQHLSPPLLESVRLTNKISQNLHAELFLRAVAGQKIGIESTDVGLKLEQDFLKAAGIAEGDAVLVDGSGLSHNNLVTPRAIVQLLAYAARQPWGEDFRSTLPIAGVDGTLESRMKGTAAAGRVQAKTGSLEHVHSIAGYATTTRGEHLVFAIFGNNNPQPGHDAVAALDEITVAMIETLGAGPAQKKKK